MKKTLKHTFYMLVLAFTFFGCEKKEPEYYKLNLENQESQKAEVISNQTDHYLYNLKITKDYYCFLSKKNNTLIHIYGNDDTHKYEQVLFTDSFPNQYKRHFFTKETLQKSSDNTLFLIDDEKHLLKLHIGEDSVDRDTLSSNLPPNSREYNITSNTIFASTFGQARKSPYYRFSNSEYEWITPDPSIKKKVGNSISYINHLCVNEKQKRAVVAYRFVNFLSFYDLEDDLQCTVEIENNMLPPEMESGSSNTTKFFIDIYGTGKYVYCLYSGSVDLTAPARILKFDWDGKHIDTFLLDRPVQLFAVDEKKNCIIAVSSYDTEGQDIVRYAL